MIEEIEDNFEDDKEGESIGSEQPESSHDRLERLKREKLASRIAPWQWKKGQSGNPGGRVKGKSMKEYAREMLACQTEEERQAFMHGLSKEIIWKMGEGNPDNKVEGNLLTPLSDILKDIRNNGDTLVNTNREGADRKESGEQKLETEQPILDKGQGGSEHKVQDESSPAIPSQASPLS